MGMASLLDDTKFREFLVSGSGRYQPIPVSGLYNPHAVRAEGCNRRWEAVKHILPKDTPLRILDVGCSLGRVVIGDGRLLRIFYQRIRLCVF
jgi:hypothetical protein